METSDQKNLKVTMKSYPSLNHLFMENKGMPDPEVYKIKQNIPSFVIKDIATWIIKN